MSNSDAISFAPNMPVRGGIVTTPAGDSKTSLATAGAVDHIAAYAWGFHTGQAITISYAYRANGTVPDSKSSGFSQFTATQIVAAEKSLAAWSDVANIRFTRADGGSGYSDNATILLGNYGDGPAAGFTYLPGSRSVASSDGDVWINASLSYNVNPTIGNYGGQVLIHEIGHAIGLTHPGTYDASDTTSPTYSADAEYFEDSRQYTVMSYFASTNTGANLGSKYSAAPLLDDISAVQALYGANMATRADDTIYGFHATAGRDWYSAIGPSSQLIFAAWDAGGNDTFDFSGYAQDQRIDLRAGDFSDVGGYRFNVAIANNVTIENAIGGSGHDTIIGNAAANLLQGGSGNDSLFGEAGNDTLQGGVGNDQLDGGSGTNQIDGGDNVDVLLLPGTITDYHTTLVGGSYVISGNGLVDTISNIETIALRAVGATSNSATFTLASFVAQTPGGAQGVGGAPADFNGDGRSDILWRNVSGAVSTWQFGGTTHGDQIQQSVANGFAAPSWQIAESADFDGDGRADILWRNVTGGVAVWNSSASGAGFTTGYLDASIGTAWKIAGAGDLNGDAKADILWRNDDGSISTWLSTGPGFSQNSFYHSSVGTDWKVEGLGDFNGDGRADILWRNDNGQLSAWLSSGAGFVENRFADAAATSWHINGIADFSGDGKDDIIWRNDSGALSTWVSNGSAFVHNVYYDASVGNSWHIATTGDFNDDGKADLLWRNDNGAVSTWESSGAGFVASIANASAPTSWTIFGHAYPL